jgi:hypothetical protein
MIDAERIRRFEETLEPWHFRESPGAVRVLGYGEISTVFSLADDGVALKRLPLFASAAQAQAYAESHRRYTRLLAEAGLELPPDDTAVVELQRRPAVLYIAQQRLPTERFAHALVRRLDAAAGRALFDRIDEAIDRVFAFNERRRPELELAIDGQLSNWALLEDGRLLFVDTSTPLHRVGGQEQLDPELFLASAPRLLRGLLRLAFLDEVMSRYYDRRRVFLDLVANLYKEQRPDRVADALACANARLGGAAPLTVAEVRRYYAADKRLWSVFLALRRLDRWACARSGRRYEFVLPGPIRR